MRSWLGLLGIVAACGGKVVVDGDPGGNSGGAGSGGAPSSSSSSSNSASSVSASTGPSVCEDGGDCGRCFGCASENECAALADACVQNGDCEAFQECTTECQDIGPEACLMKCQGEHPSGASDFLAWIDCGACGVCAESCAVAFSFFCN